MHFHFVGIAGAGMASLARYLLAQGESLSGSDRAIKAEGIQSWESLGVRVYAEHAAAWIQGADRVVYSAAVPANNPERQAAEKLGLALSRGQLLAQLANAHAFSVAVCGTHGKGTTAAAIVDILQKNQRQVSYILGAKPVSEAAAYRYLPDAEFLVSEVDESDKTHLAHRPKLLLINNVEVDHLNHYANLEEIVASFETLVRQSLQAQARVVIHYAGVGAAALYKRLQDCHSLLWIAEAQAQIHAQYRYKMQAQGSGRYRVDVYRACACMPLLRLQPQLLGKANAQNLAVAAIVSRELGAAPEESQASVASYQGLCDRCQKHTGPRGFELYTDYASHPTAIHNDLCLLHELGKRITAVYHPYRYSLMQHHWNKLSEALALADRVYLAPFDGAGEAALPGISNEALALAIAESSYGSEPCIVQSCESFAEVEEGLKRSMQADEVLVIFGGTALFELGHRVLGTGAKA